MKLLRRLLPVFLFSILGFLSAQEDAYHIELEVEGYEEDILTIAYNLLDKQYVSDTLIRAGDGKFHLRDTAELAKGIYLAVLSPSNAYFQFLVGNEPPFFSLKANKDDLSRISASGSADNQTFYDYLAFLDTQSKLDNQLKAELESVQSAPDRKAAIEADRKGIFEAVTAYQDSLVTQRSESFAAMIIKVNQRPTPPEFPGLTEEERREKQWRYVQRRFFDNVDLTDERLLRTPFLYERLDYYVHKLHVQHPDSIALAINEVLRRMTPGSDMLQAYLSHHLNEAAGSKIVGMDAIYVYLIDNYYSKGLAPWSTEDNLRKFKENADRLRPILIGRTAPDIKMQERDGSAISLHEVDSEYTILYFWQYECGHCKASTPVMKEFYDKWKDRGVTLFAVCTKIGDEVPGCWDYIDDKEIGDWMHTVDPYLRSKFVKLYDIKQTPSIFVLDKDKKIISKRIGADQLDELMGKITEQQANGDKTKG